VMGAYNRVNGESASASPRLLGIRAPMVSGLRSQSFMNSFDSAIMVAPACSPGRRCPPHLVALPAAGPDTKRRHPMRFNAARLPWVRFPRPGRPAGAAQEQ